MNNTENIRRIREELDLINKDVKIIVATKTRDLSTIKNCMDTGIPIGAGENRVQELIEKYTPEFRWDFIGRLQTNKVKYIIDKVELIHSLDRISLAETVQKECEKHKKKQQMLVEINTGAEENKGGILLEELDSFLDEVSKYDKIEIKGLMTVAPSYYNDDMLKSIYDKVYETFFIRKTKVFNELSMGMSGDYLLATKCGATIVRPGRAVFGERSYK